MPRLGVAVAAIALIAAAATYQTLRPTDTTRSPASDAASARGADSDDAASAASGTDSPFAVDSGAPAAVAVDAAPMASVDRDAPARGVETADAGSAAGISAAVREALQSGNTAGPAPDPFTAGLADWTDEQLLNAAAHLRADSDLLQAVMDEFRSETDPERLQRLVQLLREADVPGLTELARELAFSGNTTSQLAALDLLQATQAFDPEAQSIIVEVLGSASSEAVLLKAMDAAAVATDDAAQRTALVAQVLPLVEHSSVQVRRHSVSALSRWSDDPATITPVLVGALDDAATEVRTTAAYALVDYPHVDSSARSALLAVAENAGESKAARQAAILALRRAGSADLIDRISAAERQLNRRNPPE